MSRHSLSRKRHKQRGPADLPVAFHCRCLVCVCLHDTVMVKNTTKGTESAVVHMLYGIARGTGAGVVRHRVESVGAAGADSDTQPRLISTAR